MKMLFDCLCVKEVETKSVVLVADKAKKYPEMGEVIAVGPGDYYAYPAFVPTSVKVGDRIYFSKDRAYRVELKSGTHYIVRERDVMMILEKGDIK
jgi:chaperonin GroES